MPDTNWDKTAIKREQRELVHYAEREQFHRR